MQGAGFELTAAHEATHWWFVARRELFLHQVAVAVAELGHPARPLRLLDYGCGTGFNLGPLARFGEVWGADRADEAFGALRANAGVPRLDLRRDEPAHEGRFDILTALDVLEHTDDDVAALRAMRRFLAPAGQMVLTVPAFSWLWSGEDVISQHRRRYTRRSLLVACRAAGLPVAFVSYANLAVLPAMTAVVWGRRAFTRDWAARSNLGRLPVWVNGLLGRVAACEARWVGTERVALPLGASLVCRLRIAPVAGRRAVPLDTP
jgi:SAM-dependent methyltransferase